MGGRRCGDGVEAVVEGTKAWGRRGGVGGTGAGRLRGVGVCARAVAVEVALTALGAAAHGRSEHEILTVREVCHVCVVRATEVVASQEIGDVEGHWFVAAGQGATSCSAVLREVARYCRQLLEKGVGRTIGAWSGHDRRGPWGGHRAWCAGRLCGQRESIAVQGVLQFVPGSVGGQGLEPAGRRWSVPPCGVLQKGVENAEVTEDGTAEEGHGRPACGRMRACGRRRC